MKMKEFKWLMVLAVMAGIQSWFGGAEAHAQAIVEGPTVTVDGGATYIETVYDDGSTVDLAWWTVDTGATWYVLQIKLLSGAGVQWFYVQLPGSTQLMLMVGPVIIPAPAIPPPPPPPPPITGPVGVMTLPKHHRVS